MAGFGAHKGTYLLERNALFTLSKNSSDKAPQHMLPAALALAVLRAVKTNGLDSKSFDPHKPGTHDDLSIGVKKDAPATSFAIDQFVELLPPLRELLAEIYATRKRSEAQI